MTDIKTLRDKLNGSLDLMPGETKEQLQREWDLQHAEMEALKAEDERNYVGFGE